MISSLLSVEYPLLQGQLKEVDVQLKRAEESLNWNSEGGPVSLVSDERIITDLTTTHASVYLDTQALVVDGSMFSTFVSVYVCVCVSVSYASRVRHIVQLRYTTI